MSWRDEDPFYDVSDPSPSCAEAEQDMRDDLAELTLDDEIWRGMQTGDPLDDVIREIFAGPVSIEPIDHPF